MGVALVGAPSALLLKAATLLCILLALSVPSMTIYQTKVAVAFLADTSASVTPQDLKYESALADKIESQDAGRHWMRVIPFARVSRAPRRPTNIPGTAGSCAIPRPARPRHQSGSGHPRWRGRHARRHGAADRAGFRRQRKSRQRGARHLAGAAARHSHRHRAACRPLQAGSAARIGGLSRVRCSAASISRWKSRSNRRAPPPRRWR
jgi:hypothetical protein